VQESDQNGTEFEEFTEEPEEVIEQNSISNSKRLETTPVGKPILRVAGTKKSDTLTGVENAAAVASSATTANKAKAIAFPGSTNVHGRRGSKKTELLGASSSSANTSPLQIGTNSDGAIVFSKANKRNFSETEPGDDQSPPVLSPAQRKSGRQRKVQRDAFLSWHHDSFVFLTSEQTNVNSKFMEKLLKQDASQRESTMRAILEEFENQDTKSVYQPVYLRDLSKSQRKKVLPSQMFSVTKYGPDGKFIKVKSRLVAGGHRQRHDMYERDQIASPTAGASSIFTLAHIAAVEKRCVMTCDIRAAYLNAEMPVDPDGEPIIMYLDKVLTPILLQLKPEYEKYVDTDTGRLYLKLEKALYGCIQSAKLWYDRLTLDLAQLGFEPNPSDPCVLNAAFGETQCSIALYVDDLFVTCENEQVLRNVEAFLKSKYGNVSATYGKLHDYLGMSFDFSTNGEVNISQTGLIANLVDSLGFALRKSPAGANLFNVQVDSPLLSERAAQIFHSHVASLLYLAKRTRPDLLTAVSFLTTRVAAPTKDDEAKLLRVLGYLNGTKDLVLTLKAGPNPDLCVHCYIDSSYATHPDCKSHSGVVISLGCGAIYAKSSRQKLVTKSSTEAELVALANGLEEALALNMFLKHQGYDMPPIKVLQDNQSTMLLATEGYKRSSRTKHMQVRYFWTRDLIKRQEIILEYLATHLHLADVLTKPLQSAMFRFFRNQLLGSE